MKASQKLLDRIQQSEGLILQAKWDVSGWAIGYGHHGPEVHAGLVWTTLQAKIAFEEDVAKVESQVETLVKVSLTQGQFDALVDFVYNLGAGRLQKSTLLELLNQQQYAAAGKQLLRWDETGGKANKDLLARRTWELQVWNS
jgi:lysozyme